MSGFSSLLIKFKNKTRELISYREMFVGLVNREVRARYKGSFLGFFWSLLNPLLLLIIYSLVFSVYMRVNIPNYPLFLFCGLLPWVWFSTSITNATAAVVANASLIKKIYFPHEILPLVNVTTNLINFLLSLPVLLAFMLVLRIPLTLYLLYLPLLIVVQFLVTLGLALILCTLNAFFRDIEQLISPLLMAWFYTTPIAYSAATIPPKFKFLLLVNPLAPIIAGYQNIFFDGQAPSLKLLALSAAFGLVLFLAGYAIFYRHKFTFAEVV